MTPGERFGESQEPEWDDVLAYVAETTKHLEPGEVE